MRAILSRFFRRGDLKDAKKVDKSALHLYFFSASEVYEKNISLKKRSQLLPYQIRMLEEVVKTYEQDEKNEG